MFLTKNGMKKILYLSLFLLIVAQMVSAQEYEIRQALDFYRANKMMSGDWKTTLSENDIEGSPYLNDDFIPGTIFTVQKLQFVDIPFRYNIYNDQLEFKTESGQIQAMANPEIIEKVKFGTYEMDYLPYTYSKKIRKGFFIILKEGKASLYAKKNMNFKNAEEPGAYKEAEPAKFVSNPDDYFIRIGMEEAKLIGNKKDLLDIFPDHQKKIESFVKKNKIKTNKSESLIELVNYYNSL